MTMRRTTQPDGPRSHASNKKEEKGNRMTERNTLSRRLAASVGAFALATMGLLGTTVAHADPGPGNITEDGGTLNIHKFGGDPVADAPRDGKEITDTSGLGDPLDGVEFSVCRVAYNGTAIDLSTSAGWDLVPGAALVNGALPTGYTATACESATTDEGTAEVDLDLGLYLVTETGPGDNQIVSPVVPFLVSIPYPSSDAWLYDVHVYPKNKLNETEPTKTVADPGQSVVVDDVVTWTITAPIPPLADGDTYRSFVITDQLDSRLTANQADIVVAIDDEELTLNDDYTVTVVDGLVTITLTSDGRDQLTGAENVVVTLPTTVGSLGETEFSNDALVNVNGSSQDTDKPKVNWGSVKVVKHNAAAPIQTLADAEFEIWTSNENGTLVLGNLTTDENGEIVVNGLWVGVNADTSETYWLKETKAPTGYVLPTNPWTQVTVTAGLLTPVDVAVPNTKQPGPSLPLTGGMGTAIFGGTGLALVVVAVAAGLSIRRKQTAK
jgi:fimbrial isopeptide formation D2 family protein